MASGCVCGRAQDGPSSPAVGARAASSCPPELRTLRAGSYRRAPSGLPATQWHRDRRGVAPGGARSGRGSQRGVGAISRSPSGRRLQGCGGGRPSSWRRRGAQPTAAAAAARGCRAAADAACRDAGGGAGWRRRELTVCRAAAQRSCPGRDACARAEPVMTPAAARPGPLARLLTVVVRAYQLGVSPLLLPRCRFTPSCSEYALEALRTHGAARGVWLTVRRLARCQPLCRGGWDPVPDRAVPCEQPPAVSVPVASPRPPASTVRGVRSCSR